MKLTSYKNFVQNKTAGWEFFLSAISLIKVNQFTFDAKVAYLSRLFITMEI